jgi:hypothetical protein
MKSADLWESLMVLPDFWRPRYAKHAWRKTAADASVLLKVEVLCIEASKKCSNSIKYITHDIVNPV